MKGCPKQRSHRIDADKVNQDADHRRQRDRSVELGAFWPFI